MPSRPPIEEIQEQPPFTDVEIIGEGTFTLDRKLAEGGQASVFLAREVSDTHREVAVKIVECSEDDLHKGKPSILSRFQSEVRTWNEFSTSSYVVKLFYTYRYRTGRTVFFAS